MAELTLLLIGLLIGWILSLPHRPPPDVARLEPPPVATWEDLQRWRNAQRVKAEADYQKRLQEIDLCLDLWFLKGIDPTKYRGG